MDTDIESILLTLDLDGSPSYGDDYWLKADTFSSVEQAKRAHHYWTSEMTTNPRKEQLFFRTATVTNVKVIHKQNIDSDLDCSV